MDQAREERIKYLKTLLPPLIVAVVVIGIALVAINFLLPPAGEERCARTVLAEWRDSCYGALARETGSLAYCAMIKSVEKRDSCYIDVRRATGPLSEEACERITAADPKDSCYDALAAATGNASICERIAAVQKRDQCISAIATAALDPSACSRISEETLAGFCTSVVYNKLAVSNREPSYCRRLMANATDYAAADQCLLNLARETNETRFCSEISDESLRVQCSMSKVGFSQCDRLTDPSQKDACYYGVAVGSEDPADCAMITGASLRDNCYYQIAQKKKDEAICDSIQSNSFREFCRSRV